MISSKTKSNIATHNGSRADNQAILQDPETLVGVKTTRVYSQIARMSRCPHKQAERALLIAALEGSSIKSTINGKTIKKDPPFVTMKALDVKRCFGHRAGKFTGVFFVNISSVL